MKVLIIVVALICAANAIQILPGSDSLSTFLASIFGDGQQGSLISLPSLTNSFNWLPDTISKGVPYTVSNGVQNCNYFPNLNSIVDEELRAFTVQINSWMCTCTRILVQLSRSVQLLLQYFPRSYAGIRYRGNDDECWDEVERPRLYVGSDSNVITIYSENEDGTFTKTTSFAAQSPSEIVMDRDGRAIYTFSQSGENEYNLTSYTMDSCGGTFHQGYTFDVHDDPEYLAVSPSSRYLLSDYSDDGYVYADALGASDGQLTDAPETYRSFGPFGDLQNSLPQQIVFHPSKPDMFGVAFKNLDVVQFYKFDDSDGTFQQLPSSAMMRKYSGPSEFVFSKDNRYLFVCSDYDMSVTSFLVNELANFTSKQVVSTLQPSQTRQRGDYSVLRQHPSGDFLYVLNPHRSAIAKIGVNPDTGMLTYLGTQSTADSNPQDMRITDDGTRLIVSNKNSNSVTVYSIDQKTGALGSLSTISDIDRPTAMYYYDYGMGMNFDSSELDSFEF